MSVYGKIKIKNLGVVRTGVGKLSSAPVYGKTHVGKFLDMKTKDSFGVFITPEYIRESKGKTIYEDKFKNTLTIEKLMEPEEVEVLFNLCSIRSEFEKVSIEVVDYETIIKSILI